MRKTASILIFFWIISRLIFHSFDFSNSKLLEFFYFAANDAALIGFFLILYSFIKERKFTYLSFSQSKKLGLLLIIYASWCMVTDILMLVGIGAHDFWVYTAISILIISIGILWVIFV